MRSTDESVRGWFEAPAAAEPAAAETTRMMPTVAPARVRTPPPMVVARAVIVYQDRPRRPWRLWAFTAVLVALTIGVVLGQSATFEPDYRPPTRNAVSPVLVEQTSAPAATRVAAPLGTTRARTLEVTGASSVLDVVSADLGDTLFEAVTVDASAAPRLTEAKSLTRLELVATGTSGTIGVRIRLHSKVAWTLRLAGGAVERTVDLRAGGLARLDLADGAARTVLRLPAPRGTVRVSTAGPDADLLVHARTKTPVRLRLAGGAQTVVLDKKTQRGVQPGATLTSAGWRGAANRYELTAAGAVTTLRTARY